MIRWLPLLALAGAAPLAAQDTATVVRVPDTLVVPRPAITATLTLAEALRQARANSPAYRQVLNDAGPARWGVRNAYGSLLPSVTASAGLGYTGSGQQVFGGTFFSQTSPSYNSDYQLLLNWQLSGRTLTGPAEQRAFQRAIAEDIGSAGVNLTADVTDQYLAALQAGAQVQVQRQQVARNTEFLQLAQVRNQVGQATLLDVRQAEVTRGTSEVALLRAVQAENDAKLELFRRMGIVPPVAIDQIGLTDSFVVAQPAFNLEELLQTAETQNPSLRALRARENASEAAVRAAKSEFLPSLSLTAGWSGFTQQFTDEDLVVGQSLSSARGQAADCEFNNAVRDGLGLGGTVPDCNAAAGLDPTGTALNESVRSQILRQNDVFPFDYSGQPFRASLTVSLPIFTGFGRSLRVAQAQAARDDADESLRAQGLQVRSLVHSRMLAVETSFRAIAVQRANQEAAREQLRLAQDRYRLGSGTSLELADAQTSVAQAEADYVNAVYDYHRAVAALEAAVGRPLR